MMLICMNIIEQNYLRMRGEYLFTGFLHSVVGELPPHARRIP